MLYLCRHLRRVSANHLESPESAARLLLGQDPSDVATTHLPRGQGRGHNRGSRLLALETTARKSLRRQGPQTLSVKQCGSPESFLWALSRTAHLSTTPVVLLKSPHQQWAQGNALLPEFPAALNMSAQDAVYPWPQQEWFQAFWCWGGVFTLYPSEFVVFAALRRFELPVACNDGAVRSWFRSRLPGRCSLLVRVVTAGHNVLPRCVSSWWNNCGRRKWKTD